MPIAPGTKLGSYEVLGSLGAGGMGEVYRARDTKLNRDVAIKVLPELVTADSDRVARFAREAQLLAALNHPNIAQIYGLEETKDGHALVMELVDGEDLAHTLRAGALPLADALSIARQIADALEAAHEKGIIHRDMKPGNVMLTRDGQVKVLDFGLGKALEPDSSASVTNSPTMTVRATQAGMILGTAGYMSPEQAKGRAADKRSDVWAFGCILFEMLTGRRAFEGEDVSDTLASVLRGEPDWTALPSNLPPAIRTLMRRCLVKDRTRRISDISTAKFLLNEPDVTGSSAMPASAAGATPASGPRAIRLSLAVSALVGAIAITAVVVRSLGPAVDPASVARLSVLLPPGHELHDPRIVPLALSPDGLHLVYAANSAGKVLLYHRALDAVESKAIPGTEGAQAPFFKPDSKWVGFFANGQVKKVALDGGALEVICPSATGRGGSWSDDGYIYFSPTNFAGIWRVSEAGGTATEYTHLDRAQGEVSHRWPQALPGNQGLIFTVWTGPGPDEKHTAMQTASGEKRILVRGGEHGRYVPPGYLVYARSDNLMAFPFDLSRPGPASGVPVRLPGFVRGEANEGAGFEVSSSGTLAMMPAGAERLARRVVSVDQTGRTEPLPLPVQTYEQVRVSPDGTQAIVQVIEGVVTLWLYDFKTATLTPFARTSESNQAAVWTPDSKRVIYRATRKGVRNLYWKAADGTDAEVRLTTKEGVTQTPQSVSPDGKWLIFSEGGGETASDVWIVSLSGDKKVQPILVMPRSQTEAQVSPGGTWLAFVSDDSGRDVIYVRPFPGPGPRIPISRNGGDEPLWSRDGRQLYFLDGDRFMAADVTVSPAFSAGVPRQLYEGQFMISPNNTTSYALSPDGKRFLRVQPVHPEPPAARIDVVVNWREELRRLVK